ncbi:hypothetical protein CMUS01_08138 [Colletotrichum musicola]|uniref:Uncharacterized protein n=1 Tax=Colletotrichum musicola TaxID=2175873 RepID=A0A8H6KEF8_9PEZI|nr:hypothetical protein CMUS01_08138 [Colletotrichum musicola]
MNTPYLFLILVFLPLILAAPRVSPREDGCPIGATSVPSVTYTVMAPVQTIMIDKAQDDGCPWLKDASQPVLAPPMPSSSASNPDSDAAGGRPGQALQPSPPANPDGAFDQDDSASRPANAEGAPVQTELPGSPAEGGGQPGQAAQPSPSADGSFDPAGLSGYPSDGAPDAPAGPSPSITGFWIPGFPAPSGLSPDGTNRGPSAAASSIGDVPGGSQGDGGPYQPSAVGPGAAVPTGGSGATRTLENGNFGQALPTDESRTTAISNNPATTLRTQANPPPSSTGDPPPRFVIFAGSSSKTFNVPHIHQAMVD